MISSTVPGLRVVLLTCVWCTPLRADQTSEALQMTSQRSSKHYAATAELTVHEVEEDAMHLATASGVAGQGDDATAFDIWDEAVTIHQRAHEMRELLPIIPSPSPEPEPARVTLRGCECMQYWVHQGTYVTSYCGNPDFDAREWCFVVSVQCEQGSDWGYCKALSPPPVQENEEDEWDEDDEQDEWDEEGEEGEWDEEGEEGEEDAPTPPMPPMPPPDPPAPPSLPPRPPNPPLLPAESWALTADQLRDVLSTSTASIIFIPSGHILTLGGEALSIPAGADVTIKSTGDGSPAVIDGEGRSRLFRVTGGRLRLIGLDLVNGGSVTYGAGLCAEDNARVELINTKIARCFSTTEMFRDVFSISTLIDAVKGGALYSNVSNVLMHHSTITDCYSISSHSEVGVRGAGLYAFQSMVTMNYSKIKESSAITELESAEVRGSGIHASQSTIMMTGSTIANCAASTTDGADGKIWGSGIYADESQVTIMDSIIANCSAITEGYAALGEDTKASIDFWLSKKSEVYGSGLSARSSNVTMMQSTISNCSARTEDESTHVYGSGIYAEHSNVTIMDGTISHCSARTEDDRADVRGSGICAVAHSTVTMTDTKVANCFASTKGDYGDVKGSGLYTQLSDVTLNHVAIVNCAASASGNLRQVHGSGLYAEQSNVMIMSSTVANCSVSTIAEEDKEGGVVKGIGLHLRESNLTLMGSRVANCSANTSGKFALVEGSGLHAWQANVTMMHSIVADCSASTAGEHAAVLGGGAFFDQTSLLMFECEFRANSAKGGQAIYVVGRGAGDRKIISSAFINPSQYDASISTVEALGDIHWTCATVGRWMPLTGRFHGDLEPGECRRTCAPGYYATEGVVETRYECSGECPMGHYCVEGMGPHECLRGTYADRKGSSVCSPCGIGNFSNTPGAVECSPCPPGSFSSLPRASSCDLCPSAGFCAAVGAAAASMTFEPCPVGTWSSALGANSSSTCIPCEPGSASKRERANSSSTCQPCPPGSYAALAKQEECTLCPPGFSQPQQRSISCQPCEGGYCEGGSIYPTSCELGANLPHAEVPVTGASSSAACVCKPGYYDSQLDSQRALDCRSCFVGTNCSRQEPGLTIHTLPISRGYYRMSANTSDVRRCPDAAAGCSSDTACQDSNSGCRGGRYTGSTRVMRARSLSQLSDDNPLCDPALTGVFCRLCASRNDSVRVFYSEATSSSRATCKPCRDRALQTILLATGLVLAACVLYVLFLQLCRWCLSTSRRQQLVVAWGKFEVYNKLKILIGFYIVASKIPEVYDVETPVAVRNLLSTFAISVSFGFSGVSTVLECLNMRSYQSQLALYMIVPFAIALLLVLVTFLRLRCKAKVSVQALLEAATPLMLRLIFLAYPLVTNYAFEAFYCYEFTDSKWLKADVMIQCATSEHYSALAQAWVAIGIYSVGLLALVASLLFAARSAICFNRPTALSCAISFLFREFETEFFWWELVEMLRRLILIGLMVLAHGTMLQLWMGTFLATAFLLFQVQASPYQTLSNDFLASACSFALVVIFLTLTSFKYLQLTDLDNIQRVMSEEQKDLYGIKPRLLTLVMFVSIIGVLVFSLVLFIMQVAYEGARFRREARAAKSRRLRFKADGAEVEVVGLQDGHFHTFLSHVWGTGQDQMRIVKQRLAEMLPELRVFLDVDDLEEIGNLEGYIERTECIIVYCSNGYFTSMNCMRELVAATEKQKPVIPLLELESSHGGLSLEEICECLLKTDELNEKWGFPRGSSAVASSVGLPVWPGGAALHAQLFAGTAIEWNRIGHFQDVTMRLIAECVLGHGCLAQAEHKRGRRIATKYESAKSPCQEAYTSCAPHTAHKGSMGNVAGTTYVDRELTSLKMQPLRPPKQRFHVFCSQHNPGAAALMNELARECHLTLEIGLSCTSGWLSGSSLFVTTNEEDLEASDHMLLYLTSQTWTRGDGSIALAAELNRAMNLDVHVLLAHEMPGIGGQAERYCCEFRSFFSCPEGSTPPELLTRGIYSEIAVPLKGSAWREVSMLILALAVGLSKDEAGAGSKPDVVKELDTIAQDTIAQGLHHSGRARRGAADAIHQLRRNSVMRLKQLPRPALLNVRRRCSVSASARSGSTTTELRHPSRLERARNAVRMKSHRQPQPHAGTSTSTEMTANPSSISSADATASPTPSASTVLPDVEINLQQ